MQVFDDYQSFVNFIEKDMKVRDFNPVRFINVDTMDTWVKVKSYIGNKVPDTLKLSDFCSMDDIAPNLNQLKKAIRLRKDSTLVIPLSEYLRINNSIARKTIYDILHTKFEFFDISKNRIYVLLYRMNDLLLDMELSPKEINTVISISEALESDFSLTVIQNNLRFYSNGNDIDGFKKYFIYWEQNPNKPIVLHTKNAINYSDIIFSDNVEVIISSYKLLRHYGLPQTLTENMGSVAQWSSFQEVFVKLMDFELSLSEHFNISKYSDDLFKNWVSYNDIDRWLLWLWAHLHTKDKYLLSILKQESIFGDFIYDIKSKIIEQYNNQEFSELYSYRKNLIKSMKLIINKDDITNIFINIEPVNKLRTLTNCSMDERMEIIKCVSEINNLDLCMPIIKEIYPLLYFYLQPLSFNNDELNQYFTLYRISKIYDNADIKLLNMVEDNANKKCEIIYELPARNFIVNNEYDENSVIYFVDSFGSEYVNTLISFFDKSQYEVSIKYSHCNLPSITEFNNDFFKDKNYITPFYELDKWKHSYCEYPKSIEHELSLISEVANNVFNALQDNKIKKVIIAGDHGTSRFAVKNRGNSNEIAETTTLYKYGRYGKDPYKKYDKINSCVVQDDFWIFSNYDHFVQKGAPTYEIHGGASIEEMVVPVISIHKIDQRKTIKYHIKLINDTYKKQLNKSIIVSFRLSPCEKNVEVSIDGKKQKCTYENEVYSYEQIILDKKELYTAKIIISGKIIGEISYKVDRPVMKNNRFDI